MKIEAIVRIGTIKENCDDSVLINSAVINDDFISEEIELEKLCIADGVGGNKGGKDASLFVLNKISTTVFSEFDQKELEDYLLNLNDELISYSRSIEDKEKMATTFTGIFHIRDGYYLAHVGNTRLYITQSRFMKQVTSDQTQYQFLMDMGRFEDAKEANQSAIMGCFGNGDPSFIKTMTITKVFDEGLPSMLVMTSDGIHDYLEIDDLEDNLQNYQGLETLEALIDMANDANSLDDKSIVVLWE